jgi:methionyl-tRNA formyltransferase
MGRYDLGDLTVGVIGCTRLTQCLLDFLSEEARVLFVITLRDPELVRKADSVRLDDLCAQHGTQLLKPRKLLDVLPHIRTECPDLLVEFGDSRIIPRDIVELPKLGTIGNHGAILPGVKGAASLVWGRLCDAGWWGVSLFYLTPEIDEGPIIATTRFDYEQQHTMREFVDIANQRTMSLFQQILPDLAHGRVHAAPNAPPETRVPRHADSYEAVRTLREALSQGRGVYMPPRVPSDSLLKLEWPDDFARVFKIANDAPYPRFILPESSPTPRVA